MIYGILLLALVLLTIGIVGWALCQPAAPADDEPVIVYTQAGKVHRVNGLQKR